MSRCECGECRTCKHRAYSRAYYHSSKERKDRVRKHSRENYRKKMEDPVLLAKEREYGRKVSAKRRQDPKHREHYLSKQREYRAARCDTKDTIKGKARIAVRKAVLSGNLVKPSACPSCKKTTLIHNMHAHHHDYTKTLEITWLCVICHSLEHRIR